MTLQIHTDLQGNLSAVWRDPYEWVDPFAEAEFWALTAGENHQRYERERREDRDHFSRVEAHLNGVIQSQQAAMMRYASLQPMPPIILKGHAVHHKDGDPNNNEIDNIAIVKTETK